MSQKSPRYTHRNNIGTIGEDIAEQFLRTSGYRILSRNFRIRYGELDIVAVHDGTLVIVEVKTRLGLSYGSPESSVTSNKLNEVVHTSYAYRQQHPETPGAMRIDVIAILLDPSSLRPKYIRHLKNVTS